MRGVSSPEIVSDRPRGYTGGEGVAVGPAAQHRRRSCLVGFCQHDPVGMRKGCGRRGGKRLRRSVSDSCDSTSGRLFERFPCCSQQGRVITCQRSWQSNRPYMRRGVLRMPAAETRSIAHSVERVERGRVAGEGTIGRESGCNGLWTSPALAERWKYR